MAVERIPLYDGAQILHYDDDAHVYTLKGHIVDNATSILRVINKPALVQWAANMASTYWADQIAPGKAYDELYLEGVLREAKSAHRKVSGGAKTAGTFLHGWLEHWINSQMKKRKPPSMPHHDGMKNSIELYQEWEKDNTVDYLYAERKVLSVKNLHCGTADAIALVNGQLEVIDFKTGKGIYAESALQLASYAAAFSEESGSDISQGDVRRRIVHIPIGKKMTMWDDEKIEKDLSGQDTYHDYKTFLIAKSLYQWTKEVEKKTPWFRKKK